MRPAGWLERLQGLATRFADLGIASDLSALPEADLWGIYRFLSRLADRA